nr:unnamed protein product [Digitaria exilis]
MVMRIRFLIRKHKNSCHGSCTDLCSWDMRGMPTSWLVILIQVQYEEHWEMNLKVFALAGFLVFIESFSLGIGDISNQHERISRKPCDTNQLARLMNHLVHLQLSHDIELLRHILRLCNHLWAHHCVRGAVRARTQRKNLEIQASMNSSLTPFHK